MKKGTWINIIIVLAVIVLAVIILVNSKPNTNPEEAVAKCVGENSILYVQLGCHHCENQIRMFGNYSDYLTVVDCFYERDKCGGVRGTPSWEINGVLYEGVQSFDTLVNLTGC